MSSSVSSPRVVVFDRGERTMKVLAIPAPPAEGNLLAPAAVAVDPSSVIYVADSHLGKVFGYDLKGTLLMVLGRAGDVGKPVALAADHARGWIYVADTAGHQVKVFTTLGNLVATLGDPSNPDQDFRFPAAITVDKNGRLYVLDSRGKRVYVYDPERKFVQRFSLRGGTEGSPVQPRGIAVDSEGYIYVTDIFSNNVLIYDRDGALVQSWGRTGSTIGDFWSPMGIFIDKRDLVYIADQMNSRIQVFQLQKTPVPVQ
jgi:DNA-binding beta-propeller fold protein YncE